MEYGSGSKRKHTTLLLADKLKIIEEAVSGGMSHEQIGMKYRVGKSSVSRFIKNKTAIQIAVEKYREYGAEKRRTLKEQHFPLMEEALFIWILQQREVNIIVPADIMRAKADSLFKAFQEHDCYTENTFLASNGWARRFKERFSLPMADEKAASGRKLNRTRYTFMPCANLDGSLKLKLMYIGKSENPRDLPRLPASYYSSKKACMTRILFRKWFEEEFVPAVRKFCQEKSLEPKALLVLDNCSAHHDGCDLKSDDGLIQVIYLPPNVTSECQPMDRADYPTQEDADCIKSLIAEVDKMVGTQTSESDVKRWLNDLVIDSEGNVLCGTSQVYTDVEIVTGVLRGFDESVCMQEEWLNDTDESASGNVSGSELMTVDEEPTTKQDFANVLQSLDKVIQYVENDVSEVTRLKSLRTKLIEAEWQKQNL
ncbi:tigger transposable element-derived protein 2-like [Ochlerotatus camptorhynchus]|uniref:tigger transposable element-derived protein 2-like n=1 Tax=Ochlerotatus camptorhynchus TaxID=644619 RepID=UPI0031DF6034